MTAKPTFPFHDSSLPLETRVHDLVSRLSLEEKIGLMPTRQEAVKRLGIPEYRVGGEAAHGLVARDGVSTVFPQTIGLSCTWDTDLMFEIGNVVGDEARAYYKKRNGLSGLTLWAPTVDLERDPRWGRTEEAYGEDPYLTGRMSTAYTKGMHGDHPYYIKAVASLKHFYANNNEKDRLKCSSSIDPRNKREYYLKAFEPSIKERSVHSLMTSYNSINGTPAICHPDVNDILKNEWKLDGFIVCDGADMHMTVDDHRYCQTYAEAVALAIKGGIDCVTDESELVKKSIREALEQGLLAEEDLDRALRNVFRIRFRLGQFDPEEENPYTQIPETVIYKPEHRDLALRAARESIVLLKNENQTLPLNKEKIQKAAVIGPLGDVVYRDWYTGNLPYYVTPLQGIVGKLSNKTVLYKDGCDQVTISSEANGKYISPKGYFDGSLVADKPVADNGERFKLTDWGWGSHTLKSMANGDFVTTNDHTVSATAKEVWGWFVKELFDFVPQEDGTCIMTTWNGKRIAAPQNESDPLMVIQEAVDESDARGRFSKETVIDGTAEAVRAARECDVAIVIVGNHPLINGKEEIDRPDITLPPSQEKLIREVYAANPNTVVIVIGSYPYALNWSQEHIPAIVYSTHGGQEMGNALADVLFGDYNPAGRLNMTWYRSVEQLPDMMDYDIIKGERTYLYFESDPLYPFGYGLSYTRFRYSDLQISSEQLSATDTVKVRARVENDGSVAGDEVVQLYVKAIDARIKRPRLELKGFARIHLQPGESRQVEFAVPCSELSYWDVSRDRYVVETGEYAFMIGKSSADIQLTASIRVNGETVPPRNLFSKTRAENYNDYEGVFLNECKEGGTCIGGIHEDDWICFKDADLNGGVHFFEARVASTDGGSIDIRLDRPDGPLIGTCLFPATGGQQTWHTHTCSVAGAAGIQSVYLVFKGSFNLSWFRFINIEANADKYEDLIK